jgi:hypothetical protein
LDLQSSGFTSASASFGLQHLKHGLEELIQQASLLIEGGLNR